jgi:hypothetical protein
MLHCQKTEVGELLVTVLIADVLCYIALMCGIQQCSVCPCWMSSCPLWNMHAAKVEKCVSLSLFYHLRKGRYENNAVCTGHSGLSVKLLNKEHRVLCNSAVVPW